MLSECAFVFTLTCQNEIAELQCVLMTEYSFLLLLLFALIFFFRLNSDRSKGAAVLRTLGT